MNLFIHIPSISRSYYLAGFDYSHQFAGAKGSPLAKALFQIDGVSGIFLGSDYVTVNITVIK
jgi:hypothetical protein